MILTSFLGLSNVTAWPHLSNTWISAFFTRCFITMLPDTCRIWNNMKRTMLRGSKGGGQTWSAWCPFPLSYPGFPLAIKISLSKFWASSLLNCEWSSDLFGWSLKTHTCKLSSVASLLPDCLSVICYDNKNKSRWRPGSLSHLNWAGIFHVNAHNYWVRPGHFLPKHTALDVEFLQELYPTSNIRHQCSYHS